MSTKPALAFPESRDRGIAEIEMPGHAALQRLSNAVCPLACDLKLASSSLEPWRVLNDAFEAAQSACDARGGKIPGRPSDLE